jgi:hypothetical protein
MNSPDVRTSLAEQRERLALSCELDRLRLRLALRPLENHGSPQSGIGKALAIGQLVPGKIGRWARRLAAGADFFQSIRRWV